MSKKEQYYKLDNEKHSDKYRVRVITQPHSGSKWDSSFNIDYSTGWTILAGAVMGFFLFTTLSRPVVRPTQPPIQGIMRTLIPEVKQPGCEPASSAIVKNAWSYTSTPMSCQGA
jgi:hypothetical protein